MVCTHAKPANYLKSYTIDSRIERWGPNKRQRRRQTWSGGESWQKDANLGAASIIVSKATPEEKNIEDRRKIHGRFPKSIHVGVHLSNSKSLEMLAGGAHVLSTTITIFCVHYAQLYKCCSLYIWYLTTHRSRVLGCFLREKTTYETWGLDLMKLISYTAKKLPCDNHWKRRPVIRQHHNLFNVRCCKRDQKWIWGACKWYRRGRGYPLQASTSSNPKQHHAGSEVQRVVGSGDPLVCKGRLSKCHLACCKRPRGWKERR